jgi:hypothetical protein
MPRTVVLPPYEREAREAQLKAGMELEGVTRCGLCAWSFAGPFAEGTAASARHRLTVHDIEPKPKPVRRKTTPKVPKPAPSGGRGSVAIDLTGHRYGHWLVLRRDGVGRSRAPMWKCRCECGNCDGAERRVAGSNLRDGKSQSCGQGRGTHHGHASKVKQTRTYAAWCALGRRGTRPDRWRNSFENFLEDMGEAPKSSTTVWVMRRDPSQPHGQDNSVWVGH